MYSKLLFLLDILSEDILANHGAKRCFDSSVERLEVFCVPELDLNIQLFIVTFEGLIAKVELKRKFVLCELLYIPVQFDDFQSVFSHLLHENVDGAFEFKTWVRFIEHSLLTFATFRDCFVSVVLKDNFILWQLIRLFVDLELFRPSDIEFARK